MKKIPVGATIAHAYRFAFGDFLTVLRAMWVPLTVQTILMVVLIGRIVQFMKALQANDPSATASFGRMLLLYPIILVLFFMQFLAVTETALGLSPKSSRFYFPLGKKLWRLIGGFLLALLAMIALVIAAIIGGYVLGFVLQTGLNAVLPPSAARVLTALLGAISFLAGFGGLIFCSIRFFFLLAPASIAEERLGVGRAWLLTRGSFWRVFLILLSILIPYLLVEYSAMIAAAGWPQIPHDMNAQAVQAARLAWNIAAVSAIATYWYVAIPLFVVMMVLYFGALCSAQAFTYRTLTEGEALDPVAGD